MEELAEVLRAWRNRLAPQQAGLPPGTRRRAPGLRREELAGLAGVSVEYLVRLEQGRARNPSPQVLAALARALRLTDAERDHLYRVGGVAVPTTRLVPQHIGPGTRRLLDRLRDVPAAAHSAAWDILWWNPLWVALTGDPAALRGLDRNVAWRHFTRQQSLIDYDDQHAEEFSRDLAADLRQATGCYPEDPSLKELIERLKAESDVFDSLWGQAHIARHRSSRKTATSTPVGPITFDCDVLSVPETDLRIVVYTAESGSADAAKLALLSGAGTPAF